MQGSLQARTSLLGTLVAVALGCGGEGGERPASFELARAADPGSGPYDCRQDDGFEVYLLEDFERGAASGRVYSNNEVCYRCKLGAGTPGGVVPDTMQIVPVLPEDVCRERCIEIQEPSYFEKPVPATLIQNGGRCQVRAPSGELFPESRYALRVRGGPYTDWGGSIGIQLNPPVDASSFESVCFWARVGPDSSTTLQVQVADQFTDEKYRDQNGNPVCQANVPLDDTTQGCDKFTGYALLGPDWRFYTLWFSELRQAGWGKKAPYLDVWGLRALTFFFKGRIWDLWLDDVGFCRQRRP